MILEYVEWLKNKGLEYVNDQLHIGGMNTIEIAKQYGTPIFVINEELVRQRYKLLKTAITKEYLYPISLVEPNIWSKVAFAPVVFMRLIS